MARGRLRIYLGAAPGVGKTYAMLGEGRRRFERGTDVVIGYVESHGRARTAAQVGELPVVARRTVRYRGATFEEMDLDALLRRRPEVALVDELAHTNVPGSRNEKRWQDVHELLDAGIDVISTVNIQHLESLNDVVETITGVQQRETVPDEVVRAAEQVELVDMTPEALRRRMAHGNVYAPDKADEALRSYFRPGNLGALRELALLWVADRVDEALRQYRTDHDIARPWEARERVVVAITGAPSSEQLIRRAARIAERSRGDLIGVHIRAADGRDDAPEHLLERHRQLLDDLGGDYHELVTGDVVVALVDFAHVENATQMVLGATRRSRWAEITQGSVINRVIRASGDIDVHVISTFPDEDPASTPSDLSGVRPAKAAPLPSLRRRAGWIVALVGPAATTLLLANTRGVFGQGSQLLISLLVVLAAAALGGVVPAVVAALLATAALNWYFTPPQYTWTIDDHENLLALVAFLVVGLVVGVLVTAFARRSADARRAHAEAQALARIAAGMVAHDDPLPAMLERILRTLDLRSITVRSSDGETLAAAGDPTAEQDLMLALSSGSVTVGGDLGGEDARLFEAFAAHLGTAVEQRALREEAVRAERLAVADELRTAILRAVSHDLRTPLASIKASVSSLLQDDIDWPAEAEQEFLATIDEEADRLDRVIGNLLDASRLEAGSVHPVMRHVALDDVVPASLASISGLGHGVEVEIAPTLPLVAVDPGLLERAIANLVANADVAAPAGTTIRVVGVRRGDAVELSIIDHGPGVATEDRERIFDPFQRLGDTAAGTGVGLGLAVAKGIVSAMGGSLDVKDTPGGGLTMVVTLPAVDPHG